MPDDAARTARIRIELGDSPVVRAVMLNALDLIALVADDPGCSPVVVEAAHRLDAAFRGRSSAGTTTRVRSE